MRGRGCHLACVCRSSVRIWSTNPEGPVRLSLGGELIVGQLRAIPAGERWLIASIGVLSLLLVQVRMTRSAETAYGRSLREDLGERPYAVSALRVIRTCTSRRLRTPMLAINQRSPAGIALNCPTMSSPPRERRTGPSGLVDQIRTDERQTQARWQPRPRILAAAGQLGLPTAGSSKMT